MKSAILGKTEPDPIGKMLGTGYVRFNSPTGLVGLAKWTDERLDILAVVAPEKGRGMFREFIAAAKEQWNTICVWEAWNPVVNEALERYGFKRAIDVDGSGEQTTGWRWDKVG